MSKRIRAFTLVELLVVIAIMAVLLTLLAPALTRAREQARTVVCLANMKSLATCWYLYAVDNEGRMVSSYTIGSWYPDSWVDWPIDGSGNYLPIANIAGVGTVEDRIRGIENGLLFPYAPTHDIFHCQSDGRMRTSQMTYRSYSIQNNMYGNSWAPNAANEKIVKKLTHIKQPSEKFVFLEETDPRGINMNSWYYSHQTDANGGPISWGDPLSIWHGESTNFGFADGHSENKRWVDESTLEMGRNQINGISPNYAAGEGDDIRWVHRAYQP